MVFKTIDKGSSPFSSVYINPYIMLDNNKNVTKKFTIIIPAQQASMSPPTGPILAQAGIKIKDFCDKFNKETEKFPISLPLQVSLTVYKDSSFDFILNSSSVSTFYSKFLDNIDLNLLIYKIAKIKHHELSHLPFKSVLKTVIATYYARNIK